EPALLRLVPATLGVDPDRMAAKVRGGAEPADVVLHRGGPGGRIGVAEGALEVAHDQDVGDPLACRTEVELVEVRLVVGMTEHEGVDVLDARDPEIAPGDDGE